MTIDPIQLTADLIKCPSVTPAEGGAIALLETVLSANGFTCTRIERGGIHNLFARWGRAKMGAPLGLMGIRMWYLWAMLRRGRWTPLVRKFVMGLCMGAGPQI